MNSTTDILISVIICTHRRVNSLALALESLTRQAWRGGGWEVLVVENDTEPSPEVGALVQNIADRLPVRLCYENVPKLSRARNRGAHEAKGEYLAYLDDDAEAKEKWLEALMEGCSRYHPDICGGPSYALFRSPKAFWYQPDWETSYLFGDAPRTLEKGETLGGMNFVVRRELLLNLGGFSEALGMAGKKLGYGEETFLMQSAWKAFPTLKVQYLPDAAVLHEVRAEKMTIRWQIRRSLAGGRSSAKTKHCNTSLIAAARQMLVSCYHTLLRLPGLVAVLLLDLFRPGRTLWRRYVKENMVDVFSSTSFAVCLLWRKVKGV